MATNEQNGEQSEDEAFRKHLRQMLDNGPGDGETDTGNPDVSTPSYPTSSVDLDETSQPPFSSLSLDDGESPFKSPDVPSGGKSYGGVEMSATAPSTSKPPTVTSPVSGGSKFDQVKAQVKEFSLDTFRTTKQLFNEMVGKGTKTFDPKVDVALSELRVLQTTYRKLLDEVGNMQSYIQSLVDTQKRMTHIFGELALRDPKLSSDYTMNAETQKVVVKNAEQLLGAISFFASSLKTLCDKTMQDCLDTAKKYEYARLQYDTYRTEHEQVIQSGTSNSSKSMEIKTKFEAKKKSYEQWKADVVIKLQFLEENRNKVVHRQLLLFHNATAAFFSGNQQQLETILTQFSIQLRKPNAEPPSWLEK